MHAKAHTRTHTHTHTHTHTYTHTQQYPEKFSPFLKLCPRPLKLVVPVSEPREVREEDVEVSIWRCHDDKRWSQPPKHTMLHLLQHARLKVLNAGIKTCYQILIKPFCIYISCRDDYPTVIVSSGFLSTNFSKTFFHLYKQMFRSLFPAAHFEVIFYLHQSNRL